ncbi:MAG: hypothetical protein JWM41_3825 [Gemmatimonadetes bacterium]|nr:hypothetical protein [Gemmatimonadota bacterium]
MSIRRKYRPQSTTDQRSPDERLEALVREPNLNRAERMMDRIRDDLDLTPEPGPWIAAARSLSERLIISENSLYHLVEIFTECVVFAAAITDAELVRIGSELRDLERAHGLREGETWHVDDAPPEWRALSERWSNRADAVVAARLRELGHPDIAAVLEQSRSEFERRAEQGEIDLWGESEELDQR